MNIKEFKRPTTTSDGVMILDHVTPDEYEFIFKWCDLVGSNYSFKEYLQHALMSFEKDEE